MLPTFPSAKPLTAFCRNVLPNLWSFGCSFSRHSSIPYIPGWFFLFFPLSFFYSLPASLSSVSCFHVARYVQGRAGGCTQPLSWTYFSQSSSYFSPFIIHAYYFRHVIFSVFLFHSFSKKNKDFDKESVEVFICN